MLWGPMLPRTLVRRFMPARPYSGLPARLLTRHAPTYLKLRRAYHRPHKVYGNLGTLEVRLARTKREIKQAQRLRFDVFYREMSAVPKTRTAMIRRLDGDSFDRICDHLLVIDHAPDAQRAKGWVRRQHVVGTYRVLRQEVAERHGGFYTQGEYDLRPLIEAKGAKVKFMELGRSCVLKPYRNKRTLELLWHGLWTYVREYGVDVMVGCASFEGVDPAEHAMSLSFLHHFALAPEEWRVRAQPDLYTQMNLMPKDKVNPKAALKTLPPLIKGYLRLGAFVGDGAVIDRQFGTVDVCMILPVERIDPRYFAHFGAPDELVSRVAPESRGLI